MQPHNKQWQEDCKLPVMVFMLTMSSIMLIILSLSRAQSLLTINKLIHITKLLHTSFPSCTILSARRRISFACKIINKNGNPITIITKQFLSSPSICIIHHQKSTQSSKLFVQNKKSAKPRYSEHHYSMFQSTSS